MSWLDIRGCWEILVFTEKEITKNYEIYMFFHVFATQSERMWLKICHVLILTSPTPKFNRTGLRQKEVIVRLRTFPFRIFVKNADIVVYIFVRRGRICSNYDIKKIIVNTLILINWHLRERERERERERRERERECVCLWFSNHNQNAIPQICYLNLYIYI